MAVLFAVDGDLQVNDAAVPFGEAGDLHGGAVGDLLVQTLQQLLPHQFRADLPLRLVGDHVLGEKVGPLRGELVQFLHQFLQPVAGLGGDGQDGRKIMGLAVKGDDLQQPRFLHGVDLVDDKDGGHAALLDAPDQLLFLRSDGRHGLHQQQHAVHIRHALLHHADHEVPQPCPWLVEARGVHQHELGLAPVHDGGDAVAGGLGLVGHDGHLLPHQGVGQRGLSHIGPPAQGNHCRFRHFNILRTSL